MISLPFARAQCIQRFFNLVHETRLLQLFSLYFETGLAFKDKLKANENKETLHNEEREANLLSALWVSSSCLLAQH